jgi:thioredoxin reductase
MHQLMIIGGGPAALSAAVFALGKQLDVCLIADRLGGWTGAHQRIIGQLGDEHLAGEEAVQILLHDVSQAGITVNDTVVSITRHDGAFQIETRAHGTLVASAVLIATGARLVQLDVPGAQEFLGWGVGYSATTHAHLLVGKTAAVIGTTDRALRGVIELAQVAERVYVIGDPGESDSALAPLIAQLPGVDVLAGWTVREINGGFNVEELVVMRAGELRRLAVDAAFIDLGLMGNSELVHDLVQTDVNGFIKVDDRRATATPGLFAAGDVTTALGEQKLIAIGEGARAAWTAYGYVLAQHATEAVAPRAI